MGKLSNRFMYYCGILVAMKGSSVMEDLKHIQELIDAEEQGLLLKLPCKVGTKVYHIAFNYKTTRKEKIVETIFSLEMLEDYKKWWFLTKAEAEKALEEMEK